MRREKAWNRVRNPTPSHVFITPFAHFFLLRQSSTQVLLTSYVTLYTSRLMSCPYASFGSRAEKDGRPPVNERPPTSSVDAELRRHNTPPVRVLTSHTDSSTVTVARMTGDRPAVRPPCGFTFEILRWPKNATGVVFESAELENTRAESAEVNSRISIPLCAASTYSSNRWVANCCRLPLPFSTENSKSPML